MTVVSVKLTAPKAQNRERLFIVAIKHSHFLGNFQWPDPNKFPSKNVLEVLEDLPGDHWCNKPRATAKGCREKLKNTLKCLSDSGIKPNTCDVILDIDGIQGTFMRGVSPCITKSRGQSMGHWIVAKGRKFTVKEMEKLFGMHGGLPGRLPVSAKPAPSVSCREWGGMLGNSIPVPLLASVAQCALKASSMSSIRC